MSSACRLNKSARLEPIVTKKVLFFGNILDYLKKSLFIFQLYKPPFDPQRYAKTIALLSSDIVEKTSAILFDTAK